MLNKKYILIAMVILISIAIFSCVPKTPNLQITIDGTVITDLSQIIELFSETHLNDTVTKDVTLKNIGNASLTIQNITITNVSNAFTLILTNLQPNTEIMPDKEETFTVRFIPTTHEIHTGEISIATLEIDKATLKIRATTLNNDANLSALTLSAGALNPTFDPNTLSYDAGDVGTSPINVTATTNDANATLAINGTNATSGVAQSVTLTEGANTITILVTAEDGTATKTYTIDVNKTEPSNDADLSALILSAGALDPVFNPNTLSYDAGDVGTSPIDVTATTNNVNASLTINGNEAESGVAESIALTSGLNTITIVVTAEDTTTIKTYTVTVNKTVPSNDADLSALTLSAGTLDPTFNPNTLTYNAGNVSVSPINVTATTNDVNATLTINWSEAESGVSKPINLMEGSNTITIIVTAENGTSVKTYTVAVNKITLSNNANLSGLTLSAGTLDPTFNSNTISYDAGSVTVSSVDVTATTDNSSATLTINGTGATSGIAKSVTLTDGSNTITILVTAPNTTTTKTYTVSITKTVAGDYSYVVTDNNNVELGGLVGVGDDLTLMTSTGYILCITCDGNYIGSIIWYSETNGGGNACLNDGSSTAGTKMSGKTIVYDAYFGKFYRPINVNPIDETVASVSFAYQSKVNATGTTLTNTSGTHNGWLLEEVTDIATVLGIPSSISVPLNFDAGTTTQYVKDGNSNTIGTMIRIDNLRMTVLTSTYNFMEFNWSGNYVGSLIYYSELGGGGTACLNDSSSITGTKMSGKAIVYDAYLNRFFKPANVSPIDGTAASIDFTYQSKVNSAGTTLTDTSGTTNGWLLEEVTNITSEFGLPSTITTPITLQNGAPIPLLKTSGGSTIGRAFGMDVYRVSIMTSNQYIVKLTWDGNYVGSIIYYSELDGGGTACLNDGSSTAGTKMFDKTIVYDAYLDRFYKPSNPIDGTATSISFTYQSKVNSAGTTLTNTSGTHNGWLLTLVTNITSEFSLPATITTPLSFN